MSTSSTSRADNSSPPVGCFKVGPKVSFRVEYDLGREEEVQPLRVTIPKDEPFDKFLWRLRNVFYGDSFERSLRQWEYVLVDRQYKKGDPLPLTSSNTYYAMVSNLLKPRSRWRHAVVRRSHSENPILRAVAEGTFNAALDLPMIDAAVPVTSLPQIPEASEADSSIVDNPQVDLSQPDDSSADIPMPDAPTDEDLHKRVASTPPSGAWVTTSASAKTSSPAPSREPPFKANMRELTAPSIPVNRAQGRPLLQNGSPLASSARSRDPVRSYLPLISSPLANRRSVRLSSPTAPATSAPKPNQLRSPSAPAVSAPTAIPPILPSPPSPQNPGSVLDQEELSSPSIPAIKAPRLPANPPKASSSASTSTAAPELFQRSLNLPPRPTPTPPSTSSAQAPPMNPTPIPRPRRPLSIVSRRRLNGGTEYQVRWNNGRDSWEPHDSLYRDYPAFVDRYLEGRR